MWFRSEHQAPFELSAVLKRGLEHVYTRGFIKGLAPGRLSGCKDDFVCLF